MRILCTGDLHLGRRSSRLPARIDGHAVSCAAAWMAIVDHAVAQQVDLVALSGDVVDEDNRFYEALGPLEKGLRRLHAAGIPVVAVTGNHDYHVLPGLARSLPAGCLRLVGVGGSWERVTITSHDGASRVHVDGWSFPTQHVRESPVASHSLAPANDAPVLGLLHGDLDVPSSSYAPLRLDALRARPVDFWLLGHIHRSALYEAPAHAPVLYPGSPQPMDPGETGEHGAWLVQMHAGRPPQLRRIPVASVRYETVDIDVGGVADVAAARTRIVDRLKEAVAGFAQVGGPLRHVSLRVRLTGRCSVYRELSAEAQAFASDLAFDVGGVDVHVERVDTALRPARDLPALEHGQDAVAFLARLATTLEGGNEVPDRELARAIEAAVATVLTAKPYRGLPTDKDEIGADVYRRLLAEQAHLALDDLLGQVEARA